MPQVPSPNMLIVWPTDQDDNDVWDVIMDTAVRSVIDGHDHSAGKGVKVPSSGLNVNANVTWSSGGNNFAVTDLLAIDFAPVATGLVAGFAGALFLNSADNELYWRTTSGTNVKFTAGAALNVAAFTGGIGGDYAAAGALVVFDDATDSYWFQQQVGSAVRQYARMRSADVDLYEYKAQPAAGVPTNRVRLASPAALAASYTLTMPAALPTGKAAVVIDNTGAVSVSQQPQMYHAGFALIQNGGAPTFGGLSWTLGINGFLFMPLYMPVGMAFGTWKAYLNKTSSGATTVSLQLTRYNIAAGTTTNIGAAQTNNANNPGHVTLSGAGETTVADCTYFIQATGGAGSAVDSIEGWQIT